MNRKGLPAPEHSAKMKAYHAKRRKISAHVKASQAAAQRRRRQREKKTAIEGTA